MRLTGLHLLLTFQCTLECDHCFVWGSPWQTGTMGVQAIENILRQAQDLGTVEWIYFEGGEPFLYYPVMVRGVEQAARLGFKVGIVTNSYWANSLPDAREWLRPLAGLVDDLSVSSDLYHWDERISRQARYAQEAAAQLGLPLGIISISSPEDVGDTEGTLMYRGRASEKLVENIPQAPWESFSECPYEDLRDPGRVHVDPLGYLHVCQGITIGNMFARELTHLWEAYDPESHPVIAPLLRGGPAELSRQYGLSPREAYADACHLCYQARLSLREKLNEVLAPDQVYGIFDG